MYMVTLAVAGWFTNQLSLAVFGIAAAAIVGWPFSAALGSVSFLFCVATMLYYSYTSLKIFMADVELHHCVMHVVWFVLFL